MRRKQARESLVEIITFGSSVATVDDRRYLAKGGRIIRFDLSQELPGCGRQGSLRFDQRELQCR
jgi:hypothetical protein